MLDLLNGPGSASETARLSQAFPSDPSLDHDAPAAGMDEWEGGDGGGMSEQWVSEYMGATPRAMALARSLGMTSLSDNRRYARTPPSQVHIGIGYRQGEVGNVAGWKEETVERVRRFEEERGKERARLQRQSSSAEFT